MIGYGPSSTIVGAALCLLGGFSTTAGFFGGWGLFWKTGNGRDEDARNSTRWREAAGMHHEAGGQDSSGRRRRSAGVAQVHARSDDETPGPSALGLITVSLRELLRRFEGLQAECKKGPPPDCSPCVCGTAVCPVHSCPPLVHHKARADEEAGFAVWDSLSTLLKILVGAGGGACLVRRFDDAREGPVRAREVPGNPAVAREGPSPSRRPKTSQGRIAGVRALSRDPSLTAAGLSEAVAGL